MCIFHLLKIFPRHGEFSAAEGERMRQRYTAGFALICSVAISRFFYPQLFRENHTFTIVYFNIQKNILTVFGQPDNFFCRISSNTNTKGSAYLGISIEFEVLVAFWIGICSLSPILFDPIDDFFIIFELTVIKRYKQSSLVLHLNWRKSIFLARMGVDANSVAWMENFRMRSFELFNCLNNFSLWLKPVHDIIKYSIQICNRKIIAVPRSNLFLDNVFTQCVAGHMSVGIELA